MLERSSTSNSKNTKSQDNTKKTIKGLLVIATFFGLLVISSVFIGNVYEKGANNKINLWSQQRYTDFYALEEDSLDMLFLGSSHSYCTFDPMNYKEAGLESYQLGMPSQLPDATYYALKDALKYQHPDVIVMEVYWDLLETDFEMKQADLLFQVWNNPELEKEYIQTRFPLNERAKYSIAPIHYQQDFFAYANSKITNAIHNIYNNYVVSENATSTALESAGEEYYRSDGYIYCDYVMTDEMYSETAKAGHYDVTTWKFSPVQREYLTKIAELCKKEGIQLVFTTAPISNVSFDNIDNYDYVHNEIASFSESLGVPYLDFNTVNTAENIFADENFRDGSHLNNSGTKIADEYLLGWLLDNGYMELE